MSEIVGLNDDKLLRSDYVYDESLGKNQSEINSSVSGSISSVNSSISSMSSSISSLNSDIEIKTQASVYGGTVYNVVSTLSKTLGGRIGSVSIEASSNVPGGWYNFVWMPHRYGNTGGGDNHQYGTLLLSPMNFTPTYQLYIVHWSSGAISNINAIKADATLV